MRKLKLGATVGVFISSCLLINMQFAHATELKTYGTKGEVTFVPSTDPEFPVYPLNPNPEKPVQPVDPNNPNGPVVELPGTQGPLSIDFASTIKFGEQEISTKKEIYFAEPQYYHTGENPTSNYVQVTDKRGNQAGWRLTVEQKTDFVNQSSNAVNKTIVGAELSFNANDGEILTSGLGNKPVGRNISLTGAGSTAAVVAATAGQGSGLWTTTFGELETIDAKLKNTGVTLMVPGSAQTDAAKYSTDLEWKLENVPGF